MDLKIFDELVEGQIRRMHEFSKKIYPHITPDDLWQPNDFPLLEENPYFRYEEGVLAGLLQVKAALLASKAL
jgi:hypothetical protein